MSTLLRDIRFALRTLRRSPAFTIAACLALVLAIAANTTVFSVVNALINFPIPMAEPERVAFVFMENAEQGVNQGGLSPDDFLDLRDQSEAFESLAAGANALYNWVGSGEPQRVQAFDTTADFFRVAGLPMTRGRGFEPGDDDAGAAPVVVLSYGFWQQSLGGLENVVGSPLVLDGESHTVVGIAAEGLFFPQPGIDLWIPLRLERDAAPRDQRGLLVIGRLAPGVTARQASTEVATVSDRLEADHPRTNRGWEARAVIASEGLRQGTGFAVTLLYGAITFVLLIACANVANLQMVRGLARSRELALRSSLGAGRWPLIRQLVIESLVLALLGGAVGFALGAFGVRVLRNLLAPDPNIGFIAEFIRLDGTVLLHTLAMVVLAGVLFGLVPALQVTRRGLVRALQEGGRGGSGKGRKILRHALVLGEVAVALALLAAAGALVRAFVSIYDADPGFDPDGLVTLQVTLPEHDYPEPEAVAERIRALREELEEVPGVAAATATTVLPLTQFPGAATALLEVEGEEPSEDRTPNANDVVVTPGYFRTMAIPLTRGRGLEPRDRADSERVAVVSQSLVERYWPESEPLGRRLRVARGDGAGEWVTVVGVVAEFASHAHSLRQPTQVPQVFLPVAQEPRRAVSFVLRSELDAAALAPEARAAVWRLDRALPVADVRTFRQVVAQVDTQNRVLLRILGSLALIALVLAAVGIYGVVADSVRQRRREIGIRMALGAAGGRTIVLVGRSMALLTAVGCLLGTALGVLFVRGIGSQLEGISATGAGGPLTFLAVAAILLLVALVASAVPAGRAVRVDPATVLRAE